jgi:hypothetical protein
MLQDPEYQHCIGWNSEIRGFTVYDVEDLEALLLNHFRSRNFSSFQRQLNYFSFKKVGKQGYVHPQFWCTRPEEVKGMRRKTNTGNIHKNRRAAARRKTRKHAGDEDALQNSTIHNVPQELGRKRTRISSSTAAPPTARPKLFAASHPNTRKYINDPNLEAITPCTTSEFMTDLATWASQIKTPVKTPGTIPRDMNDHALSVTKLLRRKSIEFEFQATGMPSLPSMLLSPTTL